MRASYGLAAVLVAASLQDRWLLGQELEMTMTGIVTRSDGQALPASRVVAYNLLRDKAFAAKTGPGGTFHLKGLPAGTYIIFAINPDGYVDVGDQGGHTPANKHLRVTLAEGETVSNLTLLADATPPPEEPLPPGA